ncbi:MAG: hypothetical protein ACRC33_06575 [Gemmataceae bacterium]
MRAKHPPPSETHIDADGTATWLYYTDRPGLGFTHIGVKFDADGRVVSSYNS